MGAGERLALGFDGSVSDDETVLMGCTADLFVFTIRAWARPEGAPKSWRVPRDEVHAALARAFDRYDVAVGYFDPPKWYGELDEWATKYGETVVVALDTNQGRRFAPPCDAFATAINEGKLTHDGDPLLTQALAACVKRPIGRTSEDGDGRTPWVIAKADTRKIDRAVAAVLAFAAANDMPEPPVDPAMNVW